MVIQQVHLSDCDLYITGVSPINIWEGTIVYRLYEKGQITKHVEKYRKDKERERFVTTDTFFFPLDYVLKFLGDNQGKNVGEEIDIKEILIDSLDSPTEPLGGNFG